MVKTQIIDRGILDKNVINAMKLVKRHLFVDESNWQYAYSDHPVPIGYGQTISQPYIVAFMTDILHLKSTDKVLEIGTGSGYQAAVLAKIAKQVYSIEIVDPLGKRAKKLFAELKYNNISVKIGDGYKGWKEHAPFDAIIVTAAPNHIPKPLIKQLKDGGIMIIPVGSSYQELVLLKKHKGKLHKNAVLPVRFVPMTGIAKE
jgi:protein-L-isoaspartate(D-aspartate) O-methyltransferase